MTEQRRKQRSFSLPSNPNELYTRVVNRELPQQRSFGYRIGSAIDRFVGVLSPEFGERRSVARDKALARRVYSDELRQRSFKHIDRGNDNSNERAAYDNISVNSLLEDTISDTQAASATLYGENSTAHSAVETRVCYEVGEGLKIQPLIRETPGLISDVEAREIGIKIKDTIDEWSECGVDRSRTMTFPQAQRLIVRDYANYGECFLLLGSSPYQGSVDTSIQFITPERVETPPELMSDPLVRMGVKFSPSGVIEGYWVRDVVPNDNKEFSHEYTFYPRFDNFEFDLFPQAISHRPRMIHLMEPIFDGQARGIPWLLQAFSIIRDTVDFHEAELIAKQVEACFGLVFKTDSMKQGSLYDQALSTSEVKSDGTLMESITPGFIQRVNVDDEVSTVDPQRPGNNFFPFIEASMRAVASSAQIPYELLAKNFRNVTFASGRLAILDGQMGFMMRRSTMVDRAMKPILRRVVYDRVTLDEMDGLIDRNDFLLRPRAFTNHKWLGRTMGLIDPVKEMTAYKIMKEEGIASESEIHSERGSDWEATDAQIFEEKRNRIDRQLALEKYEMEQRTSLGLPQRSSEEEEEPNKNQQADQSFDQADFEYASA